MIKFLIGAVFALSLVSNVALAAANSTSLKLEKRFEELNAWMTGYCDVIVRTAAVSDYSVTQAYSASLQQLREHYIKNGLYDAFSEGEKRAKQNGNVGVERTYSCQVSAIEAAEKLTESNLEAE